ncbi:hypothetical protein Mal64_26970 [Pseudobythopirellula maris]|uniref:DUF2752 domain-containing protein n=1 Tax=Pseudobythopirellula maris TaxID=2527991 RepID=A0A5C5ZIF5_9BACT|nr:DUF2752 domain-containing protein [Pseudobythopirellula maris]TWT87162.1 hypothetical protein Mal64_26970 [Pseudobythopirellula maris]
MSDPPNQADCVDPALGLVQLTPVPSDEPARLIPTERVRRHRFMLWLSLGVIAAAFALRVDADGLGVGPQGMPGARLPELCGSRLMLGAECPGCGLTRSFIALAHGDLHGSLAYHRVGWVLALAVLLQPPYRLLSLRYEASDAEPTWPSWFGWGLIGLLIGNWLVGDWLASL